jgi:hypothetical protein
MLSGSVELLPQVPAQRMVLLSFPAYCLGVMADFRAPLQRAYEQLSEHGASIDAIESGRVVMLDLIAAGHWPQAEQVGAACLEMAQQIEGSQLRRHQLLATPALAGRREIEAFDHVGGEHLIHRVNGLQQRVSLVLALGDQLRQVAAGDDKSAFASGSQKHGKLESIHGQLSVQSSFARMPSCAHIAWNVPVFNSSLGLRTTVKAVPK